MGLKRQRVIRQRVILIAVIVVVFSLALIGFIYPWQFGFNVGPVMFESYWRPFPVRVGVALSVVLNGLLVGITFFAIWWSRRKQH